MRLLVDLLLCSKGPAAQLCCAVSPSDRPAPPSAPRKAMSGSATKSSTKKIFTLSGCLKRRSATLRDRARTSLTWPSSAGHVQRIPCILSTQTFDTERPSKTTLNQHLLGAAARGSIHRPPVHRLLPRRELAFRTDTPAPEGNRACAPPEPIVPSVASPLLRG